MFQRPMVLPAVSAEYVNRETDSKAQSEVFLFSLFKGTVVLPFHCQEMQNIPPVNTSCLE